MEDFVAVLSMVGTLLLMIAVFVGAYFVSKMVGKRYQGFSQSSKEQIKIIERKVIGKDQALLVVKIADKTLLLGATPHSVEKIEELDPHLFEEIETTAEQPLDFLSVWNRVLKRNHDSKGRSDDEAEN